MARQQGLFSQLMMKSLLDLQLHGQDEERAASIVRELNQVAVIFDATLKGFLHGGYSLDETGAEVFLQPLVSEDAKGLLQTADIHWSPLFTHLEVFLNIVDKPVDPLYLKTLTSLLASAERSHMPLLNHTHQLTVLIKEENDADLQQIRELQLGTYILSVISLLVLWIQIRRRFRQHTQAVSGATCRRTRLVHASMGAGFFLDEHLGISDPYGEAISSWIDSMEDMEKSFTTFLANYLADYKEAKYRLFLELLSSTHPVQERVTAANPFLQVKIKNETGIEAVYKKFIFTLLPEELAGNHCRFRVNIEDVTDKLVAENRIEAGKQALEDQFALMTSLLVNDRTRVDNLVRKSQVSFSRIHSLLHSSLNETLSSAEKATRIYGLIYDLQGESQALNLDRLAALIRRFEQVVTEVRKGDEAGNVDLTPLNAPLNDLIEQVTLSEKMLKVLKRSGNEAPREEATPVWVPRQWQVLETLANETAREQGKSVELIHSGLNDHVLQDEIADLLESVLRELILNAIIHGIEDPVKRLQQKKKSTGVVSIRLLKRRDMTLELTFQDDGAGLSVDNILLHAVKKKLVPPEKADALTRKQIVSLIFLADMSTADAISNEAGRGMGMYSVRKALQKVDGKISIAFREGRGTTFTVRLPVGAFIESGQGELSDTSGESGLRVKGNNDSVGVRGVR